MSVFEAIGYALALSMLILTLGITFVLVYTNVKKSSKDDQ